MKALINTNFKVMRKGDFVSANADGEFVFDSDDCDLTVSQLQEIAKANKISFGAKAKKDELIQIISEAIMSDNQIPSQDTPTETDKVKEIVQAGYDENKSDDQIMIDIVNSGISFRKATRLFKQAAEELGLRVSAKDRNERANAILEDADFNPETYDDVQTAIEDICNQIEDTKPSQALAAIRKYAKANELELPKAPKGQRGRSAGGFRQKAFAWMLDNHTAGDDEFRSWLESHDKKEPVVKRMLEIFNHCKKFASV